MKKKKYIKNGLIIAITIIVAICFCNYENNHIVLTKYQYKTKKLQQKSYKIIQISDFHNKKNAKTNKKLINIVSKEKPDIIAITGDFIDSFSMNTEISLNLAKQLVKIAPVYYVTGNHEHADEEKLYSFQDKLMNAGVHIMDNVVEVVSDKITLIGLGDLSLNDNTLNQLMKKVNKENLSVLLAHEPQYLKNYADAGVDIVLSGHAHGGQIRIPFTNIGLVAPNQGFLPKYTSGQYSSDNTSMFVSRGIGNSILPLRIFNCPEIVELEIMVEK